MKYRKDRYSTGDKSETGGGDVLPSIRLDITVHPGGGGSAFFSGPWTPTPGSASVRGGIQETGRSDPPEKQLTLLALRVAILEKTASGLGKLDFVWATVVLLGGFAGSLSTTDFWCVTVILVGEGARVFSRSHELEWQHHATETSTAGGALRSSSRFFRHILHALVDHTGGGGGSNEQDEQRQRATDDAGGAVRSASSRFICSVAQALSCPAPDGAHVGGDVACTTSARFQNQIADAVKKRTGHAPNGVSLLPHTGHVFTTRNIGRLLNWLQVLSALACVALSLMRLCERGDFAARGNMRSALLLFYALALLEALLFLLEKAYWTWKLSFRSLLREVGKDCQLGAYGHVSLTRFFYDAYSRCVTGSVFDGVKMDLVSFAEELILSDFLDEQLIGVRIPQQFSEKVGSAGDTLRKVGTSPRSVERLVEMLNWKRIDEVEVRLSAAAVVCKLAGKRQNALRLSAIPGAIESVASLLYTGRCAAVSGMHPQPNGAVAAAGEGDREYDYLPFNLLGLLILKKLARDQDNCGKISNARGLLAKIIDFTRDSKNLLGSQHASDSQVRAVKHALQVVKKLVTTTGSTGKALRQGVAENVFAVSNLREVLRHGQPRRELQRLAIDVLTGLAMDDGGKDAIVGTGGLVKLLLSMFVGAEERDELVHGAGDAGARERDGLRRDTQGSRRAAARLGVAGRRWRRPPPPERGEGAQEPVRVLGLRHGIQGAAARGDQGAAGGAECYLEEERGQGRPGGVRRPDDADLRVHRRRAVRRRAAPRRRRGAGVRAAAGGNPGGEQVPGGEDPPDAAVRGAAGHLVDDVLWRRRRRRLIHGAPEGSGDGGPARAHHRYHVGAGELPCLLRQCRYLQAP